jgi:hypothetical protein
VTKEYRLSYPCDLFVTIQAESLEEAKRKLVECLDPAIDGIIVCLDVPPQWGKKYDALERLYPRYEKDKIIPELVQLEDGPDEEAEAGDQEEAQDREQAQERERQEYGEAGA